jgi:hypothetical protein
MSGYLVAGDITHFGEGNSQCLLKFFDEDLEDIDSLNFYSNYIIQDLCFIVTDLMALFIIVSKKIKYNEYKINKGRLDLIHFNKQKQLHIFDRFETRERVNCITTFFQNYFIIGMNNYIELYYIYPKNQSLDLFDSVKIDIQIVSIQTFNDIILVGDTLSISSINFVHFSYLIKGFFYLN